MAMCTALYDGHDAYRARVKEIADDLKQYEDAFDGIIASGLSGLMIAAPVSLKLGKTLGVVRHTDEKRHPNDHAGLHLITKALFLDDFITGGRTFRQCHTALARVRDPNDTRPNPHDLAYYIRQYGEEHCRQRWPMWFEEYKTPERHIVAIYMYSRNRWDTRYVHVTSNAAALWQSSCKLWPADEFAALHAGKTPEKKAVSEPVRDAQGRFAPKPKSPVPPSHSRLSLGAVRAYR